MYFLISDTHKFIIGWSAKCGCSTLKYCFLRSENIDVEKLSDVHEICRNSFQPALGPKYQRYRKYLFVRNPYTRLVSFFLNRYWENNSIENNKFMLSNNLTTFVNLVDFLFSKGFTFDTHHCELQTHNIESFQSFKYSWDVIYKIEGITTDILRNIFGVELDHVKVGSHFHATTDYYKKPCYELEHSRLMELLSLNQLPRYKYFYNGEIRSKVHSIYLKDFRYFEDNGIYYDI